MRNERVAVAAGAAALIGVFLAIYLRVAMLWPWGTDAERWIGRADPATEGWATWVFRTRHFVGYRPVAALSFVLDNTILPPGPASHAIDFAALSATLAGIVVVGWLLVRPFTTPARAVLAGCVAGTIVVFHPVLHEIAPYVPRRSYGLASGFGLWALACFLVGLRRAPPTWTLGGWGLASAVLLGLACGSNEAIFPVACLLPILGAEVAGRAGVRAAVIPLMPPFFLAIARNFVLPDDHRTGYVKKWFAYADGHNRLRVLEAPEPLSVLEAAWSYVLFPSSAGGEVPLFSGDLRLAAGLVAFWLVARGVGDAIAGRHDPARRLPAWLLAWAAGTGALYALANTWFWREGFPLLVPVALAVGAIAAFDLRPHAPRWRAATTAVALAGLAVSIGWWSPVFGLDYESLAEEVRATGALREVARAPSRIDPPMVVWLVPAGDADFARDLARAANGRLRGSGISFRALGNAPRGAALSAGRTATVRDGKVTSVPGGRLDESVVRHLGLGRAAASVPLEALGGASPVPDEVWWWDGPDLQRCRVVAIPY
jgi:hypothetical protein